ncbi:OB-fold nucleic acid binding domain-containing protein [Methanobrevibacter sp.]
MDEEIREEYEKIKDHISEEEFLNKFDELKKSYEDHSFMGDMDIARMITGEYLTEEVKDTQASTKSLKLADLEAGQEKLTVVGRVMSIANPKNFTTRKGAPGKLCNVTLADDTKELKTVFWTENINKYLKNFKEGDIIQITGVRVVQNNYTKNEEIQLSPRSEVTVMPSSDYPDFPDYNENITAIADISRDDKSANVIARIYRKGSINTFQREGQDDGKVSHLTLQDQSGKIDYTLWNKDVDLLNDYDVGDAVKILNASVRVDQNDTIGLVHQNSKIEKGDFDLPELKENFLKIGDAEEISDVTLIGVVSKIQDVLTFTRQDNTEGYVKSIEILDDTGSIRVTLWNNNALNLDIEKGDILKVIGGNIEYDDYATTGYRVNTNWNTSFTINPTEPEELISKLEEYKMNIGPVKIEQVQDADEEGEEVDVYGRILSIGDKKEFQRDDGTLGTVKSVDFADETGLIQLSLWDEKATKTDLEVGKAYLIENARTRLGMYDVQLNIGKTSRIIELDEEKSKYVSSIETLEQLIYNKKNIDELEEEDTNLKIIARILSIRPINTFERADGSSGSVQNIDIADNTGSIRLAIWNPDPEKELNVGDAVKIIKPRVNYNGDAYELSINNSSNISKPNENDIKSLPSFEEIQDSIYVQKTIDEIEDDDVNIRISGRLSNVNGNNVLLSKCPNCNSKLDKDEEGFYCQYCGEEIENPKYTLMLPAHIGDDTGEIQITFFGSLVEDLLDKKESEIINIITESGDISPLEGIIEDLEGQFIEVIADVNYNDFDESLRLRPNQILSKSY